MTEGCLVLLWWDHPDLAVEAMMIEPVDVEHGGVFDVLESMPRAVEMDEFRLVQPVEGFGERVVVAVAPRADRRDRAGLGEPLRVPDSEILRRLKESSQRCLVRRSVAVHPLAVGETSGLEGASGVDGL